MNTQYCTEIDSPMKSSARFFSSPFDHRKSQEAWKGRKCSNQDRNHAKMHSCYKQPLDFHQCACTHISITMPKSSCSNFATCWRYLELSQKGQCQCCSKFPIRFRYLYRRILRNLGTRCFVHLRHFSIQSSICSAYQDYPPIDGVHESKMDFSKNHR